eukprot:GEMP01025420.1.p1 GENE.GEMP01025420.1~~GEMP01025420.1.p1  ORF type:complete len:606 (-),score=148.37 GEMP01025420.1:597-2375(-)
MEFLTASKNGVEIHVLNDDATQRLYALSAAATSDSVGYSPNGTHLGILMDGVLEVYDCERQYVLLAKIPATLPQTGGIRFFYFSPESTFVVTWERYDKDANVENAHVYDLKSGEIVAKYFLKKISTHSWPVLKWTSDEQYVCRMVSNEIHVMDGKTIQPSSKIHCQHVAAFEVSRGKLPNIAVFVPELKGAPAICQIYAIDALDAPKARKAFYKAQEVQMTFNRDGTSVLVLTSQEVDETGETYYGNTNLYFMRSDGSHDLIVATSSDGMVHDIKWSPNQNEFIMLHGNFPCSMKIFEGTKCMERFDLGKGRRNTVEWAPYGRFFLIAGFGNLAGEMVFWDRQGGGKVMGQTVFNSCVSAVWGPDGRHVLCATLSPRMRVDNCIEIMDYTGERIIEKLPFDELVAVAWRPMAGRFKERAPSPERLKNAQSRAEPKAKVKAYRPPRGGGGLVAAQMRQERGEALCGQTTGTRVVSADQKAMSTAQTRNARKKKAKEAAAASKEAATAEEEEAKKNPAVVNEASAGPVPEPSKDLKDMTPDEIKKRIRNLTKKLREIEKLKEKSVDQLDEGGKAKVDNEPIVLAEIAALEAASS